MSAIRVETVTLPAFLASALINGDASSFEDSPEDMQWLEIALKRLEGWHVTDVSEETHFSHYCALPGWNLGADMAEYTIYKSV